MTTKKPKTVYVSFLLDETGSMLACKDATISGYNEYIATLKKDAKNVLFTLTKFNASKIEVVHNAIPIADVPELNHESYCPASLTPLYDAIGHTVHEVDKIVSGKKKNVLVVIMTDGEENSSKEYSRQTIFDLIKSKEKDGWMFVYLGANQDSYAEGGKIGISQMNVMNYDTNHTKSAMSAVAGASSSYSSNPSRSSKQGFWNDVVIDDKDD